MVFGAFLMVMTLVPQLVFLLLGTQRPGWKLRYTNFVECADLPY